jgi:hypothetical protein
MINGTGCTALVADVTAGGDRGPCTTNSLFSFLSMCSIRAEAATLICLYLSRMRLFSSRLFNLPRSSFCG